LVSLKTDQLQEITYYQGNFGFSEGLKFSYKSGKSEIFDCKKGNQTVYYTVQVPNNSKLVGLYYELDKENEMSNLRFLCKQII
jgi:hypothetical protein